MAIQDDGDPADRGPGEMFLSPYELWNFGIGKAYAFPGIRRWTKYLSVLAELPRHPSAASTTASTTPAGAADAGTDPNWWVSTFWAGAKPTYIPFVVEKPFGFVETPQALHDLLQRVFQQLMSDLFPAIGDPPFVDVRAPRFRVAFPVPDDAMNYRLPPRGPTDPDHDHDDLGIGEGKHVTVVAVIDDGLPFAHRNFRDADGKTRVEFSWLQSVERDDQQSTVLFGREYTRHQIDELIAAHGDDEDRLYREAGATRDTEEFGSLLDRHATHGAHVMDLATGYAEERGEIPPKEIRIIAVQLPNTIAWDTSGFGKDMYMLAAFHYIFNRADVIAARYGVDKPRLVVNFSYGFSGGRHDGGTQLETAINELVEARRKSGRPTALVLPAGNVFQEGMHGQIRPSDLSDEFEIRWRLQPNSRTPSYLELWFGRDFDPTGYTIEILDPWDKRQFSQLIEVREPAGAGDPMQSDILYEGDFTAIGQVSVDMHRRERWRMLVVLAPTEPDDTSLPRVASGVWTVVIRRGENGRPINEPVHCWIQRAADPETMRSGSRQSYFEDPDYVPRTPDGDVNEVDSEDGFVRRFGSLNGLATARRSLVVAGYRLGDGLGSGLDGARPARYSSAGALAPGWPDKKVDCSSMSDRSQVLPGTAAAGVRSGSRSVVQGTSTAAPFVARQLAETFATADDASVAQAEDGNYLSLLCGYRPPTDQQADGGDRSRNDDDERARARLGVVRVWPHWQPGMDPRPCTENDPGDPPPCGDRAKCGP